MTDNTKPEALDLADWLEAVGGGGLSPNRCAALLREQHARIAELESDLEAIGAGGVSGPLMGIATPPAQTADSVLEDAARLDWLEQNLFHREKDEWDTKFGGYADYNMWVLFSPKGIHGRARDIIDAARKQGDTP